MKKIILFLFLASTTLFVSCNNDDSPSIEINQSLISGNWALTALSIENGKTTTETPEQSISVNFTTVGKDFTLETNFQDATDPYTYTSTGGYTAVTTQTVLGQTTTQEQIISDFLGSGEWRVEENKLITKTDGIEQVSEIITLDEETMTLKVEINEVLEVSGISIITTGTLITSMTRI